MRSVEMSKCASERCVCAPHRRGRHLDSTQRIALAAGCGPIPSARTMQVDVQLVDDGSPVGILEDLSRRKAALGARPERRIRQQGTSGSPWVSMNARFQRRHWAGPVAQKKTVQVGPTLHDPFISKHKYSDTVWRDGSSGDQAPR